jgi:hypothetical protein
VYTVNRISELAHILNAGNMLNNTTYTVMGGQGFVGSFMASYVLEGEDGTKRRYTSNFRSMEELKERISDKEFGGFDKCVSITRVLTGEEITFN